MRITGLLSRRTTVRAFYARHVVTRTRELSEAEAAFVDAGVVESADDRISWSRFETLVEAKVTRGLPVKRLTHWLAGRGELVRRE